MWWRCLMNKEGLTLEVIVLKYFFPPPFIPSWCSLAFKKLFSTTLSFFLSPSYWSILFSNKNILLFATRIKHKNFKRVQIDQPEIANDISDPIFHSIYFRNLLMNFDEFDLITDNKKSEEMFSFSFTPFFVGFIRSNSSREFSCSFSIFWCLIFSSSRLYLFFCTHT